MVPHSKKKSSNAADIDAFKLLAGVSAGRRPSTTHWSTTWTTSSCEGTAGQFVQLGSLTAMPPHAPFNKGNSNAVTNSFDVLYMSASPRRGSCDDFTTEVLTEDSLQLAVVDPTPGHDLSAGNFKTQTSNAVEIDAFVFLSAASKLDSAYLTSSTSWDGLHIAAVAQEDFIPSDGISMADLAEVSCSSYCTSQPASNPAAEIHFASVACNALNFDAKEGEAFYKPELDPMQTDQLPTTGHADQTVTSPTSWFTFAEQTAPCDTTVVLNSIAAELATVSITRDHEILSLDAPEDEPLHMSELDQLQNELRAEMDEARLAVHEQFIALQRQLELRRDAILAEIHTIEAAKLKALSSAKPETGQSPRSWSSRALHQKNSKSSYTAPIPSVQLERALSSEAALDGLKRWVLSDPVDPSTCSAALSAESRLYIGADGAPARVVAVVNARSESGQFLPVSDLPFHAAIMCATSCAEEDVTLVPVTVKCLGDGRYRCEGAVDCPGSYVLHVELNGVLLSSGPSVVFTVVDKSIVSSR